MKSRSKIPATAKTAASKTAGGAASVVSRQQGCTAAPAPHAGLSAAGVPQLRKLAEYEQACGAAIAARASFFVPTPKNADEARAYAADVASTLREFSRLGVVPLVILEPNTSSGIANFSEYRSGAYDTALDTYFATLKNNGITDQQMGMWVAFPEGNIPVWGTVDPGTFVANVTKTFQFQKKYFPASRATILLDSKTYPSGTSWSGGSYQSLLPYVQGIPAGLIDSFGLQGFPWAPPANEGGPGLYDAKTYLRTDLAAEAARALGVKEIWLNTGTFGRTYASDPKKAVAMTVVDRQAMLDGALAQAKKLQASGFQPVIHLFAEDKSRTPEGIDWSYWAKGQAASSGATGVFKTFVHDLQAAQVPLWLFDADEH